MRCVRQLQNLSPKNDEVRNDNRNAPKALLHFSLPLLAGSIFQNLYNVFDSMIVGQMLGKEALSAVGNSYVPMLIVNSVLLGVSSGISILVSQCYGAQKQVDAQECIGTVHAITTIVGFGLSILALISGYGILEQ